MGGIPAAPCAGKPGRTKRSRLLARSSGRPPTIRRHYATDSAGLAFRGLKSTATVHCRSRDTESQEGCLLARPPGKAGGEGRCAGA